MSRNTICHLVASALSYVGLLVGMAAPAHSQVLEWVRQPGGIIAEPEYSEGVSADALGNVYIAGSGGFTHFPPPGFDDAFLSKYDAAGNHQWTQLIDTERPEAAHGVSADGLGNVYISGQTGGAFVSTAADAFLSKYNGAGVLQWTRQSGLDGYDSNLGVSADGSGNVYIVGEMRVGLNAYDAFVSKYDAEGALQWTRQFEGGNRVGPGSKGVATDGLGNAFIVSCTLNCHDTLLRKYDAEGNLDWTQPGVGGSGVSADGLGNVFTSTPFLRKFDTAGNLLWTKDVGGGSVSADGLGNVYLSGHISGGASNQDEFVSKYDAEGTLEWTRVLGDGGDVSADGLGNVYISGSVTVSPIQCPTFPCDPGDSDPFLAKLNDCPDCVPPPIPPIVIDIDLGGEIYPSSFVSHQFMTSFGDLPVTWSNLVSTRPTVNAPTLSDTGLFSWQTSRLDAPGTYYFDVTATNDGGSDSGRLTVRLALIPEPTAMLLASVGICMSLFLLRVGINGY